MQDEPRVVAICASVGGPATIVIAPREGTDRERLTTSRRVVLESLLPALVSGAKSVNIDKVQGSNTIQRVQAFSLGKGDFLAYGEYRIARIATQRMTNGESEHLEVFVTKLGDDVEKTYNVYDPMLQTLLIAAFHANSKSLPTPRPVDLTFDGDEIVTVTLGEQVKPKD